MTDIRVVRDIPYADSALRGAYDLYLPDAETDAQVPLLIYFYGGSLKKGSKDKQHIPAALAREGCAVACPDYRLYPEVQYPDFINDAADAVAAVMASLDGIPRIDRSRVFIGGHSAGAYLSMMLCFDRSYLTSREYDPDAFAGYLFLSGQPTKHMTVLEAEGLDPRRIIVDGTAPLYHVRAHGAPLLILTSDCDMGCRREQNYLLYGHLRHIGYDAPVVFCDLCGVTHGGMCRPDEAGKIPALPELLKFIFNQNERNITT